MSGDYLAQAPVAMWNRARGVWETMQVSLICGHLEPFLETWPTSGLMRDGRVFELPTRGHLTTGSECSLLRTPVADETGGGALSPAMAKAKGQTLRLTGQIIDMVEPERLPKPLLATPNTMDSLPPRFGDAYERVKNAGGRKNRQSSGNLREQVVHVLPTPNTMDHLPPRTPEKIAESKKRTPGGYANVRETVVNDLMPTPTTRDYKDGQSAHERDGVIQTDTVARAVFNSGEIDGTNWGKFAPAIKRWEQVTGREAPSPTKPDGKDGQHRLSAEFTEWMMGLPAGWVTSPEIGLTRNEALKACGNGVVPQQAVLALRSLLDGLGFDS
jgi:hypothetical protein